MFLLERSHQALWPQILLFGWLCLQSSPFQMMATSSSSYSGQEFWSHPTLNWPGNPLGSTFSQYPECSLFSPLPLLPPSSKSPASLGWTLSGASQLFSLLLLILDTAARVILLKPRSDYITPLLKALFACHLTPGKSENSNCTLQGLTGSGPVLTL